MEITHFVSIGEISIKTPGVASLADVKTEVHRLEESHIVSKSTYPNGFEITYDVYPDHINVSCNRPLLQSEDGSLIAPTL